jgi:hypothetical protein
MAALSYLDKHLVHRGFIPLTVGPMASVAVILTALPEAPVASVREMRITQLLLLDGLWTFYLGGDNVCLELVGNARLVKTIKQGGGDDTWQAVLSRVACPGRVSIPKRVRNSMQRKRFGCFQQFAVPHSGTVQRLSSSLACFGRQKVGYVTWLATEEQKFPSCSRCMMSRWTTPF